MVRGNDLVGGWGWGWGGHAVVISVADPTNGSVSADGIAAIIPIFPSGDD